MGKCRSSQDVLAEYILHEKWVEVMSQRLVEACDEFQTQKKINTEEFEELLSEKSKLKHRFRTASGFLKSAREACDRARVRYANDVAFEAFLKALETASVKISSVSCPIGD